MIVDEHRVPPLLVEMLDELERPATHLLHHVVQLVSNYRRCLTHP